MSDEIAKQFQAETPEKDAPQGRSVTLSITLHPNGQLEFSLPRQKVVAYGLLGCAQSELDKMNFMSDLEKQAASRGGVGGLLKRMNGGK